MKEIAIETPRLYLRTMSESDLDSLLEIFGDPLVMKSFSCPPFSREQMNSWLKRNLVHQERFGYGLFSVLLKSNQLLIGDCGLEHLDLENEPETELGYDFRSKYWNQGYATEAAVAVRDYSFDVLGLPSLISLIRVGNMASRRVAEKIGMSLEKELFSGEIHYWKYRITQIAGSPD